MYALSAAGYGAIVLPSAALITAVVGFFVFRRDSRARQVAADVAEVDVTVKAQAGFIVAMQSQLDRYIKQATAAETKAAECEEQTAVLRNKIGDLETELRRLKWRVERLTPKEGT